MIIIDFERCKGCRLCTEVCPKKIISVDYEKHNLKGYYTAVCTDNEQCISCSMCAVMCPDYAITVER